LIPSIKHNLKVTIVSRSWPSNEHSGVSLMAARHAETLIASGFDVSIIGSYKSIESESIPVKNKAYIASSGNGSLYSPSKVDLSNLSRTIDSFAPDVVIVEAWQTALTDATISICYSKRIPVGMISHGISLKPATYSIKQILKSIFWVPYRLVTFEKNIRKLSLITCLDQISQSNRFYDRDRAVKLEIPVKLLVNSPYHIGPKAVSRKGRKPQILVIGYFGPIKNQMEAIEMLKYLPEDIILRFVGNKVGSYYKKCKIYALSSGLESRIVFSDDSECNLPDELAKSLLIYMPSLTEVLPLTLLEAMAAGTPFVASSVGVTSLKGGRYLPCANLRRASVQELIERDDEWNKLSNQGIECYKKFYSKDVLDRQLIEFVYALRDSPRVKIPVSIGNSHDS
jgi:glycosyltransferase involved in cell wall biosynthesis